MGTTIFRPVEPGTFAERLSRAAQSEYDTHGAATHCATTDLGETALLFPFDEDAGEAFMLLFPDGEGYVREIEREGRTCEIAADLQPSEYGADRDDLKRAKRGNCYHFTTSLSFW